MPLYDYRCNLCGETFEVMQKFSDDPLTVHEGCGGEVERLISAPAIQFKGTGWYVTDYGRKGSNGTAESKPASETKTETKSETKSETAPAPAKPASDK